MAPLQEYYKGRKVMITGHTGFKGSWLSCWLLKLNAKVIGYSLGIPTSPSMYEALNLADKIRSHTGDVRDTNQLKKVIETEKPDVIIHLAAQALVSASFQNPMDTFSTNTMGTISLLEALRNHNEPCRVILITSDKCYENKEWVWGYRETDQLGGKDIYSASKAAAEIAIRSYLHTFFPATHPVKIAVGRAGNVIGGGDWAEDRLVVDAVTAWSKGNSVHIRSPQATRPWQHVLEPVSGYLWLACCLHNQELHGEAFNFGPPADQNKTVAELLTALSSYFNPAPEVPYTASQVVGFREAKLLKLNCDKAMHLLNWEAVMNMRETLSCTGYWYSAFYKGTTDMFSVTLEQLHDFERLAAERGRAWAD